MNADGTNAVQLILAGGENASWLINPNQPPDCSGATIADQSADANCQATISGAYVTGVTDPDGDPLTITVTPTTLVLGANTVTVTAGDGNGGMCSTDITVNVVDNSAPVPDVATLSDATGECSVTLTAPTATDNCAASITATTSDPKTYTTQGTFSVTWTYDDGNGNTSQQTQNVVVDDVTPPTITVSSTPITLWAPNHKYVTVDVSDFVSSVSDNCNDTLLASDVIITMATSDEEEDANGGGDGNTLNDIVVAPDCQSVQLRAERQGGGNGRVYTIHLSVDDGNGNIGTETGQVTVPNSQNGNPAIDDGAVYTVNGNCNGMPKFTLPDDNVAVSETMPEGYALNQNYPNPFNPSTLISFAVPEATEVRIAIYNLKGQLIQTLRSGVIAAGQHSVVWEGTNLHGAVVASGTYIYSLETKHFKSSRKLVFIR